MQQLDKLTIPAKGYVLVCDGARALFLHNVGTAVDVSLELAEDMNGDSVPTRDLGTDRPGRMSTPNGPRSAVGGTDWHDAAETEFLGAVAKRIGEIVDAGDCSTLILVAPPRALGVLRKVLSVSALTAISQEVGKDLTKMPINEIQRHLVHA